MDLLVPCDMTVKAVATVVGYITDGLDAVVLEHNPAGDEMLRLHMAGNARDLAIATDRAQKIGGVVD